MKDKPWQNAKWIWLAGETPEPNTYVYFHNRLSTPAGFRKCVIRITADSAYMLYVNDEFAIQGPVCSAPRYLYYDEVDVTPRLHEGDNLLAVMVHYIGECTDRYIPGPGGFLCEVLVESSFGETTVVSTPYGWTIRKARAFSPDAPRLSAALGFSEHFDLSANESSWYRSSFGENGFVAPDELGPSDREPYFHLTKRDIPFFKEESVQPVGYEEAEGFIRYDFGHMASGRVIVSFDMAEASTVEVRYNEGIGSGQAFYEGLPYMYADLVSVPAGRHIWKSFNIRAFRYLDLAGLHGGAQVSVTAYRYPVSEIGEFECSDTCLNNIWLVSSRTLKLCMEDIYMDCPQRERSQWMDAFTCAHPAFTMFGVTALTRKFLMQYAQSQQPDGRLFAAYPSSSCSTISDYSLIYVIFLEWYLKVSGDTMLIKKLYPKALKALKWFRQFRDEDCLLKDVEGLVLLDNSFDLINGRKSAALNAIYHGALQAVSVMAGMLERKDDEFTFLQEAHEVKQSFQHAFQKPGSRAGFEDSDVIKTARSLNYLNINFYYEFGARKSSGAGVRTYLYSVDGGRLSMGICVHATTRVLLNGKLIKIIDRSPAWERQPQGDPDWVQLGLDAGWNELVIEVKYSDIHWEIYLIFAKSTLPISAEKRQGDRPTFSIWEMDWDNRLIADDAKAKSVVARPWFPPSLSQTTCGHAALFGVCRSSEEAQSMLSDCLPKTYYRNYMKERVPFFCTETLDSSKLQEAVLPCNNPWSA
ncbi:MAG: hypothetical protein PHT33_07690, partial [bacterium]|nr:hypothetical protein [bacterium]